MRVRTEPFLADFLYTQQGKARAVLPKAHVKREGQEQGPLPSPGNVITGRVSWRTCSASVSLPFLFRKVKDELPTPCATWPLPRCSRLPSIPCAHTSVHISRDSYDSAAALGPWPLCLPFYYNSRRASRGAWTVKFADFRCNNLQ